MPPLPANRLQYLQMQSNGEQWRYPRTTLRCGVDIQVEKAEICWDYSTQVILWRRRPKLYHYTLLSWGCDNCLFIVSSFVNLSVWLGLDLMDTYCGLMKITIPHKRAFVNARLLSLFYLAWTFLSFQRQDFCVSLACFWEQQDFLPGLPGQLCCLPQPPTFCWVRDAKGVGPVVNPAVANLSLLSSVNPESNSAH